jgi:hypothetical protein
MKKQIIILAIVMFFASISTFANNVANKTEKHTNNCATVQPADFKFLMIEKKAENNTEAKAEGREDVINRGTNNYNSRSNSNVNPNEIITLAEDAGV